MAMSPQWLFTLKLLTALGCGLAAGVFFAFSTFIMPALARLQPPQGIAAMQSINITAINPLFMIVLFGTALACLFLAVSVLFKWQQSGTVYLLIGSVFYLVGTTHGKFGIDSRETFLVTGKQISAAASKPYNEKLTMNQFYQILQTVEKPLDLLTLTACETAVGSDRDALGIAGISIQAGAKSAIASLWQVDDQATAELITQFYQNLSQGMGRAKALQVAQKSWIEKHSGARQHPGYWAALTLVGNWL